MQRKHAVAAGLVALATSVGFGSMAVGANGPADDNDVAITGDALVTASAAALEHTGEGRVTETEVGDEESFYEVEVMLDDGSQVDVQLDEAFNVVSTEAETGTDD